MKKLLLLLFVDLLALNVGAQYIEEVKKSESDNVPVEQIAQWHNLLWNDGWERDGKPVVIPNDFQFEQPWIENGNKGRGFKPMCEATYRKTFSACPQWKGRRVVLDFDGVMYQSDVRINGELACQHEYGYTPFEVDITKYLKYDGENTVEVWCYTGAENASRWYTGGGIFRDVNLRVLNPTHIAHDGVYITTPQVTAGESTVQIQVEVDGWQKRNDVKITCEVVSPSGETLATVQSAMPDHTIQRCTEVKLPLVTIQNPQLWSPDTPVLYSVRTKVEADSMTVDTDTQHFGIRKIEYGTDFGFKLNGKKIFLQGLANHHDLGAVGVAAFPEAIEREMRALKAFGFNAIRCSHNPYSRQFYEIADRVGLLIVDEFIDKWSDRDYWGGRKPFTSIWPELMKEWIRRDRNHPSIVLWSLGNELQTRSDWSGYDTNDWGITTYRIMDTFLKRYDTTRPTTVAMFPARAGAQRGTPDFKTYLVPPELACVTEVSSFNYQWDAYHGYYDFKPDMILFQSEAVTNQLLQPYWGMNRQRGVGLAYWGGIEYWGESNGWPKKGWNYSFFRHTLEPYPQAWLVKSAFQPDVPVARIAVMEGKGESVQWNDVKVGQQRFSSSWNQPEGCKRNVSIYTNAEEVELFNNGKSLGVQKNDTTDNSKRNIVYFPGVEYGKGGKLTAVARNGGKEVARHEIETTGKAVALKIEKDPYYNENGSYYNDNEASNSKENATNSKKNASNSKENTTNSKKNATRLSYYNISATDSKGRVVPNATDSITVSVTGPASIYATDNGDHYTNDLFLGVNARRLYDGTCQLILLRKNDTTDKKKTPVTITVTSPTLKQVRIKL